MHGGQSLQHLSIFRYFVILLFDHILPPYFLLHNVTEGDWGLTGTRCVVLCSYRYEREKIKGETDTSLSTFQTSPYSAPHDYAY